MKTVLFIILFCLIAYPTHGQLTKEDLQEIESIIEKSEERTKQYIDSKFNVSIIKTDEMDQRLTAKIDNMDKRFVDMRQLFIALLAFIAAIILVPVIYLVKLYNQAKTYIQELEKGAKEVANDAKRVNTMMGETEKLFTKIEELFDKIIAMVQEDPTKS